MALLAGKRALVTGGSKGIGAGIALALAREGADVAVNYHRDAAGAAGIVEQIQALGRRALAIGANVGQVAECQRLVAEAAAGLGGLDILVNNAGVTVTKPFLDLGEEEWDRVIETNLNGTFSVAQAAARKMDKGGAIVNIGSILGVRVAGHVAPYVASKAAVIHLTKAMALELARHRIRVNALCPGYIETDLNRAFFASDAGQALLRRIPQRRLGRPEELDGALLLLCSDAGSYITGTSIVVDGGHLVSSL